MSHFVTGKVTVVGSHHLSFIVGGLIWCYILGESSSVYG